MELLFGRADPRNALGLAMEVHVGDLGQPPGGCLVQVCQRVEVAAPQQAGFRISEGPFHLSFGLGPSHPAGNRPKSIVGRERQKPRVVDRLVAVMASDDDFHVVIKTGRRDAAHVLEGADVLADGRGEVLTLDEMKILPARVAQDIAECVNPGRPSFVKSMS